MPTLSLRQAIEVSNGTLPVSSLSTQEQAQVSGAVGDTNTIDFNIPTTDPGYDATTGVWTIALSIGAAGDQHQRGDHRRLQPAGGDQEHPGAGRQREAHDRDQRSGCRHHCRADDRPARVAGARAGHREFRLTPASWSRRRATLRSPAASSAPTRPGRPPPPTPRDGDRELVQSDRRAECRRSQRDLRNNAELWHPHPRPGGQPARISSRRAT